MTHIKPDCMSVGSDRGGQISAGHHVCSKCIGFQQYEAKGRISCMAADYVAKWQKYNQKLLTTITETVVDTIPRELTGITHSFMKYDQEGLKKAAGVVAKNDYYKGKRTGNRESFEQYIDSVKKALTKDKISADTIEFIMNQLRMEEEPKIEARQKEAEAQQKEAEAQQKEFELLQKKCTEKVRLIAICATVAVALRVLLVWLPTKLGA